jgi:hypothetical protein
VAGTVFTGAMKGSGFAMATKDPIVEAGILMAGVVGRIAMRPIGHLTAFLREDGSRVAGPAPVATNT